MNMKKLINQYFIVTKSCGNIQIKKVQLILSILFLITIGNNVFAQQIEYTRPSWYFGIAGGANMNFYKGSTQQLNSNLKVPVAFHDGQGLGLFLAPSIEFHRPNTRLGIMLQAGFDSRKGKFEEVITPCNCPADLKTDLSYITIEPSLKFAPFRTGFYLYGGPRFAFNYSKSFTYQLGKNPAFPDQVENPEEKGDFSNMNENLISMQIGAGYDINLSSTHKRTQFVLSPFVSFHPYMGQEPRSVETWNITTLRVGAVLKFGRGHNIASVPNETKAVVPIPVVNFTVNAPKNIPSTRRMNETFPLRNYIFFDLGSTKIPNRYVLLKKNEVADFKEDQLEVTAPKKLSGRSDRGMVVYYNILNILGDRMNKNPSSSITLVGSSEKGPKDGNAMSLSIKKYLVDVFSINESRIKTEGRDKPKIPSEKPGGKKELVLLREGDRRVSVESNSPALLMEFKTGPVTAMQPVSVVVNQDAPIDSYVSFTAEGASIAYRSWNLEIKDERGIVQKFGPYYRDVVSLPGKSILGTRASGDYQVTMVGQTKDGLVERKTTSVNMVLWTPSQNELGIRYSVIFEINESNANAIYEKYLDEVVVPKIPMGARVIIHGHTDDIGEANHNQKLSLDRANEVKSIMQNSLSKAGRTDVIFEVHGYGEDQNLAPFDNVYPEERFYNRSVIIDILPK